MIKAVQAKVGRNCLATTYRRQGCKVDMKDAPQPFVVINMDCDDLPVDRSDGVCDFIFVSDDDCWVAPLELKRGNLSASEAARQLRSGARFADRIIPKNARVRFLPVVVVGRVRPDERRNLLKHDYKVSFRGERMAIEVLKCGRPLIQALRNRS